jgi:hypothetical protein
LQDELPLGRQALELTRADLPQSGMYFCIMEAFGKTQSIKLIFE